MDLWLWRLAGSGHHMDTTGTTEGRFAAYQRALERPHGVRPLRASLRTRNSTQGQRSYARALCHPVSGRSITPPLHTTTHQDFNIGDSFARASRLEQGALRASHTGGFRLDELDEASRRTLEGLRNGFNMDFDHLIICTHCDLMI